MATYYEFKKIIGKIFGCGNIEENEDDIDVVIQNRHYPREEANIPDFTISNAELQELYNNVVSTSSENLEFFSENSYEIAIDLDYPSLRRDHYPVIADDTINRIKYTFSFPTMDIVHFYLSILLTYVTDKVIIVDCFRCDYYAHLILYVVMAMMKNHYLCKAFYHV